MKNIAFNYNFKTFFLLALAIICTVSACVKEDITTTSSTVVFEPKDLTTTTIHGRVIDENDTPIENAQVTYTTGEQLAIAQTDEKGYFLFRNINNLGNSAYLTIEQDGKFDAFRRMSIIQNRYNYTEIKMNNKSSIGLINASTGGTLTHASSAKITLPAQGIVDEFGNPYTGGNVNVFMSWIDPSADDLSQRMVGDLSGIDEAGNVRSLGTFGMLQVELFDQSGNELNLAEGKEATLNFPVPASLQANAPPTIPLWSYDEELGTWIQEGEATYVSGEYIGTVSHFSSWNVDCLSDPIEISGQVNWLFDDNSRVSSSYLSIYVCGEKFGQKGGWLCESGQFSFYNFPKNEVFDLKIYDLCGELIYQETYGPYSEDTVLDEIILNPSLNSVTISGSAFACNNEPLNQGYVSVKLGSTNQIFPIAADGTFQFVMDDCNNVTGELQVVDETGLFISESYDFTNTEDTWEFNDITVCNVLTDYITISINGGASTLYTPGVEFYPTDTMLIHYSYESPDGFANLSLTVNVELPEENILYNVEYFEYQISDLQSNTYYWLVENAQMEITFFTYNNVSGGEVSGTYQGTAYTNQTGGEVTISGEFRIPID